MYSFSYYLYFGKKFVPDLIMISVLYLITLMSLRFVAYTESIDDYTLGSVLLFSILIVSHFPFLTLWLKRKLKKGRLLNNLLAILKIIVGIYSLIKTIIFIKKTDNEYSSYGNLLLDFLKYLFDFT